MISVVAPAFNEAASLEELCDRVRKAFGKSGEDFEFIIVENGSTDNSLDKLRILRKDDARIKYVSLSRNFGHQGGLWAGLHHATGDAVITMDGDLQHPPELIPELVKQWRDGHQVVNAIKRTESESRRWKIVLSRWFYRLISRISEIELEVGQSDFCLLDRQVADELRAMPERRKFMRGIVNWVGYRRAKVPYTPAARQAGQSRFRFGHYLDFALDGVFAFSTAPLRGMLWMGLLLAIPCLFYAVTAALGGLLHLVSPGSVNLPPGWATVAVSITFLGGIQLMALGLLGEYIARIYLQTRRRPDWLVRDKALD